MSIRIVDNKKLDLTDDEWNMYQKICRSYDRQNFKGDIIFRGLFESNDRGIIVFLNPPTVNHTSMEALCFIQNIYHHQHLRELYKRVDEAISDLKKKEKELDDKLKKL